MSAVFALPKLVSLVRARFELDAAEAAIAPVPVMLGWSERARQRQTSHRVIFVPGDDAGGTLGALGAPESPGVGRARPLARLDEVWTCYLEAEDVSAPENEAAQYVAARTLYDAWYRAVYLARIPHSILSQRWVADRTVRTRGAVLRITGTVSAVVPDRPSAIAPCDTVASIAVSELDVSQTVEVTPPEED